MPPRTALSSRARSIGIDAAKRRTLLAYLIDPVENQGLRYDFLIHGAPTRQ
jgi:hypothetical protein